MSGIGLRDEWAGDEWREAAVARSLVRSKRPSGGRFDRGEVIAVPPAPAPEGWDEAGLGIFGVVGMGIGERAERRIKAGGKSGEGQVRGGDAGFFVFFCFRRGVATLGVDARREGDGEGEEGTRRGGRRLTKGTRVLL